MNISISRISSDYNNYRTNKYKHSSTNNNIGFKASSYKNAKLLGYSLIAASILSLASCNINKKNGASDDAIKVISKSERTDSAYISEGEYHYKDSIIKTYHYFPTDGQINAENYDWTETSYPDGRIEKDSMGYKIFISPSGERTTFYTVKNDNGDAVITKTLPDLTKIVHTNYHQETPDRLSYREITYRPNGSRYTNKYYIEYTTEDSTKIVEQSIHIYNDKDILLMWESNVTDSLRSEQNNKYDKKGRLIYDDIKQEKYEYKGSAKHPYRSEIECEDCKRIKLYKPDGTIKKDYFEASDGTITEAVDSIF